jgi:hypothetical protein
MTHCATGFGFCCLFFTGVRLIPDHPECLLSAGLVNRTRIRPRAVGLNPSALRGEARLHGLVNSLRLCPSSPLPLLAHREKGEVGHPEELLPLIPPAPFSHTGRRGRLGVLMAETGDGAQGLAKKPAAGSGDALGARASSAHPAGCLQPEKERRKCGRPAMTTTPLRRPFAPHPPNPLLPHGEKGASGRPEAQSERRNAGACQKTCRWKRRCPGCARLRRAPGGMPATGEGAPETRSSRNDDHSVAAPVCPSSPQPPSPTRGEGGVWAS